MSLLKNFEAPWVRISQITVWVLATTSTFILVVPKGDSAGTMADTGFMFSKFLIAGLITLFIMPFTMYKNVKHGKAWYTLSAIFFMASIVLSLFYVSLLSQWTVKWCRTPYQIVVGEHYTADADSVLAKESSAPALEHTAFQLACDAGGRVYTIWDRSEIDHRLNVFQIMFIILHLVMACFILFALQAIICYKIGSNHA